MTQLPATAKPQVTYTTIFIKFLTIGAVSFGGGIIAYLQRMLIDDTKWMNEDEFLAALPEAVTV